MTGKGCLLELNGHRAGPVDRGKDDCPTEGACFSTRRCSFCRRIDGHVVSIITQDVAKYCMQKNRLYSKAPTLESSMTILADGFPEEQEVLGAGNAW